MRTDHVSRSAVSGKFITDEDAEGLPAESVRETIRPDLFTAEQINLIGEAISTANSIGIRATIARLRHASE